MYKTVYNPSTDPLRNLEPSSDQDQSINPSLLIRHSRPTITGQYEARRPLSPGVGDFVPIYLCEAGANIPAYPSFHPTGRNSFLPNFPSLIQVQTERYVSQPMNNSQVPDLIRSEKRAQPSESPASSTPPTPTTPITLNNDGTETALRGNFIFIMENPTERTTFRERRQWTEKDRAQKKEDFEQLKKIGGACIPCHQSKKKCGSGDPCPQCARKGKKCIRRVNHISSGSTAKSGKPSYSPGPFQQADSHLQQLCNDDSAQIISASSDNSFVSPVNDSKIISATSKTPKVDNGRISPVSWDLQGAYEGEDLMPFHSMSLLRRATYEAV